MADIVITDEALAAADAFAAAAEARKTAAVPVGASPAPDYVPSGVTTAPVPPSGSYLPYAPPAPTVSILTSDAAVPAAYTPAGPSGVISTAPEAPIPVAIAGPSDLGYLQGVPEGAEKVPDKGVSQVKRAVEAIKQSDLAKAFTGMAADYGDIQLFDVYNIPYESMVRISCPHKTGTAEIIAFLIEPVQFTIESKWDRKAIGSLADSSIRMVDNISQMFSGVTINQPILNRRAWGGTSPLEMTVKCRLQAVTDALTEVYIPSITLASYLQPRLLASAAKLDGILSLFAVPGPSPFGGKLAKATNLLSEEDAGGDPVSVKIGSLVTLSRCYVTKANVIFSKTLDEDGYPESSEVTLSFGSMDAPFFTSPPSNSAPVSVSFNNVLHDTSSDSIDDAANALLTKVGNTIDNIQDALAKVFEPKTKDKDAKEDRTSLAPQ